jgi:hypothetical protein
MLWNTQASDAIRPVHTHKNPAIYSDEGSGHKA